MNAERLRQHEDWKARRARMMAPVEPPVPVVSGSVIEIRRRVAIPTSEYPSLIARAVARFQVIPIYDEETRTRVTSRQIMAEVSAETGVPIEEMIGASRCYPIARARQYAMWRIRRECPHLSFPQIGMLFGGRDHTTVIHAFRKMESIHGGGALHELYDIARAA